MQLFGWKMIFWGNLNSCEKRCELAFDAVTAFFWGKKLLRTWRQSFQRARVIHSWCSGGRVWDCLRCLFIIVLRLFFVHTMTLSSLTFRWVQDFSPCTESVLSGYCQRVWAPFFHTLSGKVYFLCGFLIVQAPACLESLCIYMGRWVGHWGIRQDDGSCSECIAERCDLLPRIRSLASCVSFDDSRKISSLSLQLVWTQCDEYDWFCCLWRWREHDLIDVSAVADVVAFGVHVSASWDELEFNGDESNTSFVHTKWPVSFSTRSVRTKWPISLSSNLFTHKVAYCFLPCTHLSVMSQMLWGAVHFWSTHSDWWDS